jgi:predicted RNase H-like nuclease (RuvC/YqgF family)
MPPVQRIAPLLERHLNLFPLTQNEAAATGNEVVRLQQDNLLLEHRVEAMRNTEQNLKERLNQTTSLLDQERRRNQALKGA